MTASADNRVIHQVAAGVVSETQMPIYLSTTLLEGCMVSSSSGYAVSTTSSSGAVMGVAKAKAVETSGASGGANVNLLCGAFWMNNGSNAVAQAHVGGPCYVEDNQTVGTSNGGSVAGCVLAVDATMGVLVGIHPMFNYIASQATLQSNLLDYANVSHGAIMLGVYDIAGNFTSVTVEAALAEIITIFAGVTSVTGANKVGYDDSGSKTAATTAADALDELYVNATTAQGQINLPLGNFTDADGDPLAKWVDGTDGLCGYYLTNSKAYGIKWNPSGTPAKILSQVVMPQDYDDTANAVLHFLASKVGATIGDAVTFTCEVWCQTVGALHDAGSDIGGASSAMTGDATSKTVAELTLTLTAANMPASPVNLSLSVKPTNGKLGTDDVILHAVWIEYTRKVLAS